MKVAVIVVLNPVVLRICVHQCYINAENCCDLYMNVIKYLQHASPHQTRRVNFKTIVISLITFWVLKSRYIHLYHFPQKHDFYVLRTWPDFKLWNKTILFLLVQMRAVCVRLAQYSENGEQQLLSEYVESIFVRSMHCWLSLQCLRADLALAAFTVQRMFMKPTTEG